MYMYTFLVCLSWVATLNGNIWNNNVSLFFFSRFSSFALIDKLSAYICVHVCMEKMIAKRNENVLNGERADNVIDMSNLYCIRCISDQKDDYRWNQ